MAEIEKTEFEFPDEKEENPRKGGKVVEPESEIEVVDDTPEEDKYRTPMASPPDPTLECSPTGFWLKRGMLWDVPCIMVHWGAPPSTQSCSIISVSMVALLRLPPTNHVRSAKAL